MLQQIRNSLNGILDVSSSVSKGLMRAEYHKHVWHRRYSETKKRLRSVVKPNCFVGTGTVTSCDKWSVVLPMPFDSTEGAGDGIETCRADQDIELVLLSVRCQNPRRCDTVNWCFLQVDEMNVWLVVRLKVTTLQRHTTSSKSMILWNEALRNSWVIHSLSDLVGHKLRVQAVRIAIGVCIRENAQPLAKSRFIVKLLPQSKSLFLCHFKRLARIAFVQEARGAFRASFEDIVVVLFMVCHVFE
ncbi:hypothetical protein HG531_012292 [Fusarium graminearum]|nr:hypothetical protein HG531_012292 [Fusarium graminearum]